MRKFYKTLLTSALIVGALTVAALTIDMPRPSDLADYRCEVCGKTMTPNARNEFVLECKEHRTAVQLNHWGIKE